MPIDVAALKATITLDAGDFRRGIEDVRRELRDTQQEADRTASSFENLGKVIDDLKTRSIIGMGRSLSIAITAPLVLLGRELLDSAVKMDAWRRGLTSMTGSVAATRQEMQQLVEVSKMPGLTFQGAIQGAIALEATGVSAEQAKRELLAYGNALSAVGKGAPEMEQVIRQLTHIHSLTYLSNREIRSLSINIPQFREQMLLRFGTADAKELKDQGMTAADIMKGVLEQFEKMPRVTSSARNEIDNFFSSLFRSAAKVGESLVPVIVVLMHQFAPAVESAANWFSHLSNEMKIGITVFGLLAAAVGPPIFVMGLFLRSIQDIRIGLQSMVQLGGAVTAWWRGLTVATVADTEAEAANAVATETNTSTKVRESEAVGAKTGVLKASTTATEANTTAEEVNATANLGNAAAQGKWSTPEGIAARRAMEAAGVHPSWFEGAEGSAGVAAGAAASGYPLKEGAGRISSYFNDPTGEIAAGAKAAQEVAIAEAAKESAAARISTFFATHTGELAAGAGAAAGAARIAAFFHKAGGSGIPGGAASAEEGAAAAASQSRIAAYFAGKGEAFGPGGAPKIPFGASKINFPGESDFAVRVDQVIADREKNALVRSSGSAATEAAAARAASRQALLQRPVPVGGLLIGALLAHMVKETLPENDKALGKHGPAGYFADALTGGLAGAAIGAGIGALFGAGAGALPGAVIGGIAGTGLGIYRNITGEKSRVAAENKQREAETTEAAAAESRNRALRKKLEDLMKPPPPDFSGSEDAAYHAYLAQARAGAREEYSKTPQQAQLDATGGVMRQRQEVLKQRMQELLPTIEKDPEDAKAYYKASQEAWTIEDQLSKMQVSATKERENLQKKTFRDQKEIQDAQFRAMQYAAQAIGQSQPEGMRAQTYAAVAGPLVEARQKQLVDEAKRLLPGLGTDVDQTKEYWSVVQEYWQLEEHQQALVKAGIDERKQATDKATKLARETHLAAIEAQIEWATSQAANAAPGHMHGKELEVLLPVIQQQEKEMIEEIQKTAPGSLQYYKLVKDYWALEKREQDVVRNAKQEADTEQKKTRHEQLQVMELRERLLEGVMGNDPLTDDRTAKKRMVPLLLQHYKELLSPIQGETEIERLQREIEAQTVKKRLIEAAGINRKAYATTIEGGRIPLFDLGAARQLDKQLRDIEGHSQDAMLRDAMGMSPGMQSPAGASSGRKISNPWAGRYHRDFGAEQAWKDAAQNQTIEVDGRSGHYGPTWPQEQRNLDQIAGTQGGVRVYQIVVSPGASRAERDRAIRDMLEKWNNEVDPSPSGR